jgi:hypothetical protein
MSKAIFHSRRAVSRPARAVISMFVFALGVGRRSGFVKQPSEKVVHRLSRSLSNEFSVQRQCLGELVGKQESAGFPHSLLDIGGHCRGRGLPPLKRKCVISFVWRQVNLPLTSLHSILNNARNN